MSVRWSAEIAGREGGHPFADADWMRAWWAAFGNGTPCVGVLDGGRAVIALAARRGRLSSMSNYHSPVFEPAAADEAAAEAVLRAAFARREPEVFLHALPEAALPLVRRAAAGRRLIVEPAFTSPFVETGGDLEAYLKGLDSELKRRRRKLEREHAVELRLDDGGDDLDRALARGFELEGSGWKTRAGTAILSAPETRDFYTRLARAYRARGELLLATLVADGREIAWHFTLRRGPRLYMLKQGYAEDARKLAPGMILQLLTIEHCFADPGIERYELLGEVEPWKLRFANGERSHVRVAATTRGPAGTVAYVARRHGLPVARRARDAIRERRETA